MSDESETRDESPLETAIRINADWGLRGRLATDYSEFKKTRPGSSSRKAALKEWMKDLGPYLDALFYAAYADLVKSTKAMLDARNPGAGEHWEDGLHVAIRGVEYRKGFDGEKSLEYADDQ